MGLDFDAIDYCRTLIRTPAPYKCPVDKCGKSYKSIYGLQYHLVNYDHDNPQPLMPMVTPHRKKGRNRVSSAMTPKTPAAISNSPPKEALTYLEAQKVVQFDIDGKSIKVSIEDGIPVITTICFNKMVEDKECAPFVEYPPEPHIKLPEAAYKLRDDYNICDAPPRPNAYIRFIEKSAEELDGEVEYDVDEEDTTWLNIINEQRAEHNIAAVSVDTLELLMDRLEKESYFQAAANGQSGAEVDDDAVCCICVDGECQNTNVILFCDMCNLAVHQDCYGVPYIPEGQWLCRRCLQSPSRPVDCVLCPNTGGAFKQTDHNQWAHVVCALWIPEVRFANTVFLEPIDSIETIPAARWRLTCYICKQKGVGACIQCQRNSCYAAFHVTCAQQAGLHMRMDTVKDNTNSANPIIVQKTAYCDAHCPSGGGGSGGSGGGGANNATGVSGAGSGGEISGVEGEKLREKSRNKMKQARKTLAKKRTSVPLILIPTIPPDRLNEISSLVNITKKSQFIQRLIAYWTLKRQYRNGVPLLRRLQSQGQTHHGARGIEGSPNAKELYQQLKYWQCLRQDLERARLLCELVRKREKLKVAYIRTKEACVMMQLNPLEATMSKLLESIQSKDTGDIFGEPVDIVEVPDYMDVVTHPMDLSTMKLKLESGLYFTLDDFESDFNLMIRNCLAYNNKDTIFYRAGIRMRDQCAGLFKSTRLELEREGLVEARQTEESLVLEIDEEYRNLLKEPASEELLIKWQTVLEKALRLKHGFMRAKRTKHIRIEITKVKKILNKISRNTTQTDSSQSDVDSNLHTKLELTIKPPTLSLTSAAAVAVVGAAISTVEPSSTSATASALAIQQAILLQEKQNPQQLMVLQTPPCSPMKSTNNNNSISASPSGVNRRTAVLFTRKAQAALKKPELPVKEESLNNLSLNNVVEKIKSPKKTVRAKRNSNLKSIESGDGGGGGVNSATELLLTQTNSLSTILPNLTNSLSGLSNNNTDKHQHHRSPAQSIGGGSCNSVPGIISAQLSKKSPNKEQQTTFDIIPDSFRVYRAQDNRDLTDSEDSQLSFTGSTCSSCSGLSDDSGTGSDFGSSCDDDDDDDDDDGNDNNARRRDDDDDDEIDGPCSGVESEVPSANEEDARTNSALDKNDEQKPALEPLQLVWAKCRGYPWYPALIIDPEIPKGFVYNGVPLPAPPADVLALRKDKMEPVFLVLFFDVKRTWQWLPANKLELLGMDKQVDQAKLVESRKPTERKAVKKAYQDALHYQSQVSDLDGQGPGAIM